MVIPIEEKILSGSVDIAGIDNISNAILLRYRKLRCCVVSCHYCLVSSISRRGGESQYRVYLLEILATELYKRSTLALETSKLFSDLTLIHDVHVSIL
jgi:hypothetical protein